MNAANKMPIQSHLKTNENGVEIMCGKEDDSVPVVERSLGSSCCSKKAAAARPVAAENQLSGILFVDLGRFDDD